MIRKAETADLPAVAAIYDAILDLEEEGRMSIGWQRGVYPTENTARAAVEAGDLFVMEEDGRIIASGRINQMQMPAYAEAPWKFEARDDQVMVLHTLTVDPACTRRGYAGRFLEFYEEYAKKNGCTVLRIDTNAKNTAARAMYAGRGYIESGIIPCEFNGIRDVSLVCMEKRIAAEQ